MHKQISITFMSGPRDGDQVVVDIDEEQLTPPLIIAIGRREDLDICLNYDNQVSRLHAHLNFDGEHFWLEDLGSRNGTFLNEEQLTASEKYTIEPGTIFKVGRTWLRLDPQPSDVTAPAKPIDPPSDDEDPPF